MPKLKVVYM
jgi:dynein assembly factor 1